MRAAMIALGLSGCIFPPCGGGEPLECTDPAVLPNEGAWRLVDDGCDRRDADCLYEGSVEIVGDEVVLTYTDHEDVQQRATYRLR
jgi:hypothetical protein